MRYSDKTRARKFLIKVTRVYSRIRMFGTVFLSNKFFGTFLVKHVSAQYFPCSVFDFIRHGCFSDILLEEGEVIFIYYFQVSLHDTFRNKPGKQDLDQF